GGSIPDDYVSVGSGSPFAYGVLEDGHSKDIRKEDAINLVMRALRAAQQRDAASGNGYTIAIIDKDGYSELGEDDVEKRLKKISK
ncbi:MAG TPA: proteasome subunit beta, partial [Thermoplasmata archaeon]|nr:proteasome subunit beta [Thermoplasmata archaeon]